MTEKSAAGETHQDLPPLPQPTSTNVLQSVGPLSERLQGIVESMVGRVTRLVLVDANVRLRPASIDLLRHWTGIAIRAAALEGARSATKTRAELLPVPPGAVTQVRSAAMTAHNKLPKLPDGV